MTTCKHLSLGAWRKKQTRTGAKVVQHNTKETNNILNWTFIANFQGLVVWKYRSVTFPFSPVTLAPVVKCLCAPPKRDEEMFRSLFRCASIRHVFAPLYDMFIFAHEHCACARYIRDFRRPDCKYTSEVAHCHHTVDSHTLSDSLGSFAEAGLCSVTIQPLAASVWGQVEWTAPEIR